MRENGLTYMRECGLTFICENGLTYMRENGLTFICEYRLTFIREYGLTLCENRLYLNANCTRSGHIMPLKLRKDSSRNTEKDRMTERKHKSQYS